MKTMDLSNDYVIRGMVDYISTELKKRLAKEAERIVGEIVMEITRDVKVQVRRPDERMTTEIIFAYTPKGAE